MVRLPAWWPAWLPERCTCGAQLVPGGVSLSWVNHPCPCNDSDPNGHHVTFCRTLSCRTEHVPPNCSLRPSTPVESNPLRRV